MTGSQVKNVAASVRARLLNEARASGDSFDQVVQYFVIERFLYRLSQTEWADRLVVKGAVMLRAWGTPLGRPTRDIDFLGTIDRSFESVEQIVRQCLAVSCPEDGLVFSEDLAISEIKSQERYPGVRATLQGHLDGALFKLQLDVGVDDVVVPDPVWVEYPTLLDLVAPRVLVYMPVTAVAEKYETLVKKGLTNSRLRDYFDLWHLSQTQHFEGREVAAALKATFGHRGTHLPLTAPSGLSVGYYGNAVKQDAWRIYLTHRNIQAPVVLKDVCESILAFIEPPASAATRDVPFDMNWSPILGWTWCEPERTS